VSDDADDPYARLRAADYAGAAHACDVVLEGGISGGVVYPLAVCELATRYRIERFGGASAGALGAALGAAAELGRTRCRGEGYAGLARLADELAGPSLVPGREGETRMRSLFATTPENEPLIRAVVDLAGARARQAAAGQADAPILPGLLLGRGVWGERFAVARHFPGGAWLGALIGGAALAATGFGLGAHASTGLGALAALALGVAGARGGLILGGAAAAQRRLEESLTASRGFGLCSGLAQPHGLFHWLHDNLQRLSGLSLDAPLTYGDLGGENDALGRHAIELRVITTDLSAQRPIQLPFGADDPAMLVRLDELDAQLPPAVSAHLRRVGRAELNGLTAPEGFLFLPRTRDLPVLLSVRASMSFPFMFEALRLYAVRNSALVAQRAALSPADLEVHLLSDGGLCANLPLDTFDAWYPARPTFALMLSDGIPPQGVLGRASRDDLLSAAEPTGADPLVLHFDPRQVAARRHVLHWPPARAIPDLEAFTGALFESATSHRDHAHVRLTGFRERVALVLLESGEGGFHIDMPPEVIRRLGRRGVEAARRLDAWWQRAADQHRAERLEVLASELQRAADALARAAGPDDAPTAEVPAALRPWAHEVEVQTRALSALIAQGAAQHGQRVETTATQTRPRGQLRIGPSV